MAEVVRMGRRDCDDYLEFAFDDGMDAYTFYSDAKDHYREDDLIIVMGENYPQNYEHHGEIIEEPDFREWLMTIDKIIREGGKKHVQNIESR